MRQIVWKKQKSVQTKTGTYRRISCLTKSYRCLDCPGALSDKSSEQNLLDNLSEGGGDVIQQGVVQNLPSVSRYQTLERHVARDENVGLEIGQA